MLLDTPDRGPKLRRSVDLAPVAATHLEEAFRSVNAASAILWIIPIAGLIAIAFAGYLARDVLRRDTGTDAMRDVAGTINEGAVAFIRRQYTTIAVLAVVGSVVIGIVIFFVETQDVADVPSPAPACRSR